MNIILPLLDLNAALEAMIQKEGGGRYSCLECGKNMADKSKIKRHAENHLKWLTLVLCVRKFLRLEMRWPTTIPGNTQTKLSHPGQCDEICHHLFENK